MSPSGDSPVRPPRLAAWLLRMTAAREDRAFLVDDAADEFQQLADQNGRRSARRWYWHQALASAGPQVRARMRLRREGPREGPWLGALRADFGQGARWVRRHPSTAAVVVLTLAIASGSVLAAFAIVESVLLRPLPFASPERIVSIRVTGPKLPPSVWASSLLNFRDWRDRAGAFSAMSAYVDVPLRLTGRGDPRQIKGCAWRPDSMRFSACGPRRAGCSVPATTSRAPTGWSC